MALMMQMTVKGTTYSNAHIEIVAAHLDRFTKSVVIEYLVYASRDPATQDFIGNALKQGVLSIPFTSLSPSIGAFYSAIQAHLVAEYPTSTQVADAA